MELAGMSRPTELQYNMGCIDCCPTYNVYSVLYYFGLTKYTVYCKKCSCFFLCCYYAHFSDYKNNKNNSSEKWFNYDLSLLFLFFGKCQKFGVGRMMLNGEKKEDGLSLPSNSSLVIFTILFQVKVKR